MPIKRVDGPGKKYLINTARVVSEYVARVGWFEGKRYPSSDGGELVAEVAAQNEFGNPAKRIPPRPTMRPTIRKQKNNWIRLSKQLIQESLRGRLNPLMIYERLGLKAAADWRTSITRLLYPKLSDATILRRAERTAAYSRLKTKGSKTQKLAQLKSNPTFTKPLVHTKLMLNSLNNEVTRDNTRR